MGVATLITVMTLVQGANLYVENKVANLGTNVFQIARTPFAVTDFSIVIKALKYKKIELEDMRAVEERIPLFVAGKTLYVKNKEWLNFENCMLPLQDQGGAVNMILGATVYMMPTPGAA